MHQYRPHDVQEIGNNETIRGKFVYNSSESFINKSHINEENYTTPDYNDLLAGNSSINGDYIDDINS